METLENKNLELSLRGSIIKGLIFLLIPILLTNLLQSAYQFIDAYWVGKLGRESVSAITVSAPIIFLIISFGTGFSMAGTIFVAQYAGAKNKKMVDKSAGQTLFAILVVSVILSIIGFFSSEYILKFMKVQEEVFPLAASFMKISFLELVFGFTFVMFQSIMRGIGELKLPMLIILGTVILNFFLDPVFIYGSQKFIGLDIIPAMGVSGAALATLITQAISAIIGVIILFKGSHSIKISFSSLKPDFSFLKKIFFLGLPSSLEMSSRSLGNVLLAALIVSFGTAINAAYGAGQNILQFAFIPALGISIATSTMVAQNIGAKQIERATKITHITTIFSFILLSVIGLLTFIFAPELISIFIKNDSEVVTHGAEFLRIVAFTFGFMGIQFTLNGVFRASGNTMLTMILGIVSMFMVEMPLAYYLSKETSLSETGIWIAFAATNIIMAFISYLVYMKGDWKKKRITKDEKTNSEVSKNTLIGVGKN